jgi:hypothetical protein
VPGQTNSGSLAIFTAIRDFGAPVPYNRDMSTKQKPWWKLHEEISSVFERLFRPIEQQVLHDTRHRDVVGVLRQLDVGVIDERANDKKVIAFVEVQKRKALVGMKDFGDWIYKQQTLRARELVIVSEEGFTQSVLKHVRKLHPERVRLGRLHEVETGFIERVNSTCLGIKRALTLWWIASIFVQYADADEIVHVNSADLDLEAPIFGIVGQNRGGMSVMGLIRQNEASGGQVPPGQMHGLVVDVEGGGLTYSAARPLRRILITAEKQRRIWEPKTRFYAYEEAHPKSMQRGIAILSTFRVDDSRTGTLTLVITPDEENVAGGNARLAGQFEFN